MNLSRAATLAAAVTLLAVPSAHASTQTSTFTATADAYVRSDSPNKRFGSNSDLRVAAGSPVQRSFLRFNVTGLSGTVTGATLRLSPNSGPTTYDARSVGASSWTESNLSWNTQPPTGAVVGSSSLGTDGWTTVPVRALVTGSGTVQVALTRAVTSGVVSLASREAGSSRAPRLVVTTVVAPTVTLTGPAPNTNDPTPTLSGSAGTAPGDSATVTVNVYAGTTATGSPLQTLSATRSGSSWSVDAATLADGTYTAQARQTNTDGTVGTSGPRTFTVDTAAPVLGITAPADGSTVATATPQLSGPAGSAPGDASTVSVAIYSGTTATGLPVQTLTASRSGSTWSATASSLPNGVYTARPTQSDAAGNTGAGGTTTFAVDAPVQTSNYRSVVLADAPRAYWRLGESSGTVAADESGNANTGGYAGGVALGRPGALGGGTDTAATFDGVNDAMTVPSSASLNLSAGVSVEAWVKRAKSGWQVVLGKPGNGESRLENYALWINSSDNLVAYFGNGSTYASVFSTQPVDTAWHYVVATYDNATARLYIDGVLDASSSSTVRLTPNTQALNVARDAGGSFFFGGSIDEPAVYGTALSAARIQAHYEAGKGPDTTPPAVVLTTPAAGTSTVDTTPVIAGGAATTGTDVQTITVRVYAGTTATGSPLQTLTATPAQAGSWTVDAAALPLGTYTADAAQTDVAGNVGHSTATFDIVARPPVGTGAELIGAGDIAYCDDTGDEATALLLDQFPAAKVFTLGDNAYESGTTSEFTNCYAPTWGRAKARTAPTLGDHDYADGGDPRATGYFGYFGAQLSATYGAAAADPNRGYYSFDAGSWHVVALNAICGGAASGCSAATQLTWLNNDLAAHATSCALALLSAPRFSSGSIHGDNSDMQSYWAVLANAGVELVLSGDDHDYERFAPQDANGAYRPDGLREIVVGTGGRSHYPFAGGTVRSDSEARNDTTFGVLRLVLRSGSYEWEFVPESGRTFTDSGSGSCH